MLIGLYPTGPAHIITAWPIANPAVGANFIATVPPGKIWQLRHIGVQLVTDVTVINRVMIILFDFGTAITTEFSMIGTTTTVVASSSVRFLYGTNLAQTYTALTDILQPLSLAAFPGPILLPAGSRIRSSVFNLQAGDQINLLGLIAEEYVIA